MQGSNLRTIGNSWMIICVLFELSNIEMKFQMMYISIIDKRLALNSEAGSPEVK